jgi:hypothetical protein
LKGNFAASLATVSLKAYLRPPNLRRGIQSSRNTGAIVRQFAGFGKASACTFGKASACTFGKHITVGLHAFVEKPGHFL